MTMLVYALQVTCHNCVGRIHKADCICICICSTAAASLILTIIITLSCGLQAVVVHSGGSNAGHYYVFIRPDIRTNDWVVCNDTIYASATEAEVTPTTTLAVCTLGGCMLSRPIRGT